jgi:folate-binding protein YgfZ
LLEDALLSECISRGSIIYTDPRNAKMGLRAWVPYAIWNELPSSVMHACDESAYHKHRIRLGLAEGAYDLIQRQSIILEYGYQNNQAISWTKGCYMGQELMARTFHRGTLRKHIHTIHLVDGVFPKSGSELFAVLSDELQAQRVGWMGSHQGNLGLAVLHESAMSPFLSLYTDESLAGPFSATIPAHLNS